MTRWLEDIVLNEPIDLGRHCFGREEAIAFARQYEPHLLEGTADGDDVPVSGWQVALIGHRLMLGAMFAEDDAIRAAGEEPGEAGPAPGVEEIAFPVGVRSAQTIGFTRLITAKRASKSLPGWGLLSNTVEGRNEDADLVYRTRFVAFVRARSSDGLTIEGPPGNRER